MKKVEKEFEEEQEDELEEDFEEEKEDDFENEQEIEDELEVEEIDLSSFIPFKSKGTSRGMMRQGVITIINSENNGKRIILSQELMNDLEEPENLQLTFKENEIAIGEDLPEQNQYFSVKAYGAKGVIYSAGLVREITEVFNFDFSNRVAITLREVNYIQNDDIKVAVINVL